MEELKKIIGEINELMEQVKSNNELNLKGNKAAGKRARKASVILGKKLKFFRYYSVKANK